MVVQKQLQRMKRKICEAERSTPAMGASGSAVPALGRGGQERGVPGLGSLEGSWYTSSPW